MITRRSFLARGVTAAAASLFAGCQSTTRRADGGRPRITIEELRTISGDPEYYHGWPTLTRRRNGDLLLVYSGGREAHVCPFGRVEMMVSRDRGLSWSEPRVLLDSPLDDRDAGVLETRKGTLLVTTFTSLAYEPILDRALQDGTWPAARLEKWRVARDRLTPPERQAQLGQWMIRSVDGGRTWSPRYPCIVDSPHGPIQLQDGRLLYAGKELWTGDRRTGFCESFDDGRTWRWLASLPVREGDQAANYHELHAVEAEPGRLIVHIRNENPHNQNETLQSESDDGGRRWTTPHPIGVWGLPSHLLRLHDGRLLMTYGYRRPPFGNQARVSGDDGVTWPEPLTLSADGASGDLGYPSTAETGHGRFVTVWYELPAGGSKAVLRQCRWQWDDNSTK